MSGASFVICLNCERLMLGQKHSWGTLAQPHECIPVHAPAPPVECRHGVFRNCPSCGAGGKP